MTGNTKKWVILTKNQGKRVKKSIYRLIGRDKLKIDGNMLTKMQNFDSPLKSLKVNEFLGLFFLNCVFFAGDSEYNVQFCKN